MAFIHRFGFSLNEHVHFHICVVDGVFEEVKGEVDAKAKAKTTALGVIFDAQKLRFHPATEIDEATVAKAQCDLRRRILRSFVGRGLLESWDANEMLACPPVAQERLRKKGATLVYSCAKHHSESVGGKAGHITLTPLELIGRIAALARPNGHPPTLLLRRVGAELATEG